MGFSSADVDDPGIVLVLLGNTIVFKPGGPFTPAGPGAPFITPNGGLDKQKMFRYFYFSGGGGMAPFFLRLFRNVLNVTVFE